MKFSVVGHETLHDGTERFLLEVPSKELVYLGYMLESFEGLCNYTTPKKDEPILQVDVTADYRSEFQHIIEALAEWEYE